MTILHPGHIVGPGWAPLNPAGHFNPEVFRILAEGKELVLPNLGMETVHHVHADDVAQAFIKAIENRNRAIGRKFSYCLGTGSYTEGLCNGNGRMVWDRKPGSDSYPGISGRILSVKMRQLQHGIILPIARIAALKKQKDY